MILVAFKPFASAFIGLALLTTVAHAQSYGQLYQPGFPPQPGFAPQAGALSLVGTWSGFSTGTAGTIPQAEAFGQDGTFVTVSQQSNGLTGRYWGNYRVTQIGPYQLRLETQLQGYLPRETCSQVPGNQPNCHPMSLSPYSVTTVTFTSPTQISTDNGLVEQRDNQPALLQAQAPQRWVTMLPPPTPLPMAPSYNPGYSSRPTITRNACPNDDIQRSVCKYSGRLITSGGCLQCVN